MRNLTFPSDFYQVDKQNSDWVFMNKMSKNCCVISRSELQMSCWQPPVENLRFYKNTLKWNFNYRDQETSYFWLWKRCELIQSEGRARYEKRVVTRLVKSKWVYRQ